MEGQPFLDAWLDALEDAAKASLLRVPGVEFGATHGWWGSRKPRPRPHEGVDVVLMEATDSSPLLRSIELPPIEM